MRVLIVSADRTEPGGYPRNLGDAFLTDQLAMALDECGCRVTVADMSGLVRKTGGYPRQPVRGVVQFARLARSSDCVVIGGGTLIQDDAPTSFFSGLPRLVAATSVLGRIGGATVEVFQVGCDPLPRRRARAAFRLTGRMGQITLRDTFSYERLAGMGFSKERLHLGADACLLRKIAEPLLKVDARSSGSVLVALNRMEAASLSEKDVLGLARRASGSMVTFVSMDQNPLGSDGDALSPAARVALGWKPEMLGWEDALRKVASSRAVVASRMHALYMSALLGIPAIGVGGSPKLRQFCDEFRVPRVGSFSAADPADAEVADSRVVEDACERAKNSLREMLRRSRT